MGPPAVHAPKILTISDDIKEFLKDAKERNEEALATKSLRVRCSTLGWV
jgi:hypothetical protein